MNDTKQALEAVVGLVGKWRGEADGTRGCRQEHDAGSAYDDALDACADELAALLPAIKAALEDARRLDFIDRTFSGMTNRERYLPVTMGWGRPCNGRTLREACDKYMKRDAAIDAMAAGGDQPEPPQ